MGGFGTGLWGGGGMTTGGISVTGNSVVYGALRLLGVLRPGSSANADSYADGLAWLNELLDSWATERLMVKVIGRSAAITMDGSAVYYASLSHRIEGAGYISSGSTTESPLDVYSQDEWRGIAQKAMAGEPSGIYPEYTVTQATLYPWPLPASGDLYLYQWNPLEAFADLSTEYIVPPGYALALRYCLAEQIAPAFQIIAKIQVPQATLDKIERKAIQYKAAIKSVNSVPPLMKWDNPFLGAGRYDILSGRQL